MLKGGVLESTLFEMRKSRADSYGYHLRLLVYAVAGAITQRHDLQCHPDSFARLWPLHSRPARAGKKSERGVAAIETWW